MSALPSVMLKKKQLMAAEAENQDKGDKVVVLPSLEQPQLKKTDETPPALTDDELKALSVEDNTVVEIKPTSEPVRVIKTPEQYDNDFRSLKGQFDNSNRENKDLRRDLLEVKQENDALRLRLEALEKAAPKREQENDDDLKLTEEEAAEYGNSLPVLNKLLTARERQIKRSIVDPLREEIENLKKNNKTVVDEIAAVDENSFLQQVRGRVPGFDQIVASAEWHEYASQPVSPFSSLTIGEVLLKDAHPKRDLERISKIFDGFTKKAANPVLAAYAAPAVSNASAPLPESDKKPMLKLSERKRISDEFRKGRMTYEKYKQYADLFDAAEKEGRVDFNK